MAHSIKEEPENERPIVLSKKVKKCKEDHALKKFKSVKMRLQGDDFVEGRNLTCDVCSR